MKVGQYRVDISHPDKVLFPDVGLTKADLAEYYGRIADLMLRHMRDRPISMQRFPDGIDGDGFYQKSVPYYFPDWIRREKVGKGGGGTNTQLVVDNAATLVYLSNQACITPHVWLSRADDLHHPDRMIFDLDPSGDLDPFDDFDAMKDAARGVRGVLEEVGLVPFLMTSGSRGLHVVVPLDRSANFDVARDFAKDLAELLCRRHPEALTTEHRKENRGNRIFVDYLRNGYAQTAVAPYAVRARPGAPVATPLEWDELSKGDLDPRKYTIGNIFRRLAQRDDPWKGMGRRGRSLRKPRDRLRGLLAETPDRT